MCKGSTKIAEILTKEYSVKDLTPFENIDWEITNFSDTVSRVKITSKDGISFCCPVYAMFDGEYVMFYGDYGEWMFRCTWDANVYNLKYNSPYYQLEKLEREKREEFNDEKCTRQLLELVREGDWYQELPEKQKEIFGKNTERKGCWSGTMWWTDDDVLCECEDECLEIDNLLSAVRCDEFAWYAALENANANVCEYVFGCDFCELYKLGRKTPVRPIIILYMLSVVANAGKENSKTEGKQ